VVEDGFGKNSEQAVNINILLILRSINIVITVEKRCD
jgi:hypothetical protein